MLYTESPTADAAARQGIGGFWGVLLAAGILAGVAYSTQTVGSYETTAAEFVNYQAGPFTRYKSSLNSIVLILKQADLIPRRSGQWSGHGNWCETGEGEAASVNRYTGTLCGNSSRTSGQAREEDDASVGTRLWPDTPVPHEQTVKGLVCDPASRASPWRTTSRPSSKQINGCLARGGGCKGVGTSTLEANSLGCSARGGRGECVG